MRYKLRYLPLFENDLYNAASYISHKLDNPDAARRLVDEVEKAILERLDMPLSFEPFSVFPSVETIGNDLYGIVTLAMYLLRRKSELLPMPPTRTVCREAPPTTFSRPSPQKAICRT